MSKSWIGRGWQNQAWERKQLRKQKFERLQRPVTAADLAADARRILKLRRK